MIIKDFQHWLWIDIKIMNVKSIKFNIGYKTRCWSPLYNIGFSQNWYRIIRNIQKMQKQHCLLSNLMWKRHFLHQFFQNRYRKDTFYISSIKTDIVYNTFTSVFFKIDIESSFSTSVFPATMLHSNFLHHLLHNRCRIKKIWPTLFPSL